MLCLAGCGELAIVIGWIVRITEIRMGVWYYISPLDPARPTVQPNIMESLTLGSLEVFRGSRTKPEDYGEENHSL